MLIKLIWAHDSSIVTPNHVNEVDKMSDISWRQIANTTDDDQGEWGSGEICGEEMTKAGNLCLCQSVVIVVE